MYTGSSFIPLREECIQIVTHEDEVNLSVAPMAIYLNERERENARDAIHRRSTFFRRIGQARLRQCCRKIRHSRVADLQRMNDDNLFVVRQDVDKAEHAAITE